MGFLRKIIKPVERVVKGVEHHVFRPVIIPFEHAAKSVNEHILKPLTGPVVDLVKKTEKHVLRPVIVPLEHLTKHVGHDLEDIVKGLAKGVEVVAKIAIPAGLTIVVIVFAPEIALALGISKSVVVIGGCAIVGGAVTFAEGGDLEDILKGAAIGAGTGILSLGAGAIVGGTVVASASGAAVSGTATVTETITTETLLKIATFCGVGGAALAGMSGVEPIKGAITGTVGGISGVSLNPVAALLVNASVAGVVHSDINASISTLVSGLTFKVISDYHDNYVAMTEYKEKLREFLDKEPSPQTETVSMLSADDIVTDAMCWQLLKTGEEILDLHLQLDREIGEVYVRSHSDVKELLREASTTSRTLAGETVEMMKKCTERYGYVYPSEAGLKIYAGMMTHPPDPSLQDWKAPVRQPKLHVQIVENCNIKGECPGQLTSAQMLMMTNGAI
jgi:hypothetical protein